MDAGVLPYAPTSILTSLPCQLPVSKFDPSEDFAEVGKGLVHSLHNLQNSHFTDLAIWRDLFALTGSIRTFYSPTSVIEAWSKTCASRKANDFSISEEPIVPVMLGPKIGWVNVSFTFTCHGLPATACSGTLSIVRDHDGTWKIWVIRTILDGLSGGRNVDFLQFARGSLNGTFKQDICINGHSQDGAVKALSGPQATEYDCIVVGAGQAGLSSAGRLQALGISYVVLEKHASIGDNWKTRYDSARLHTPRAFNHLPFDRTFSLPYQEYLTKYDLAKGFQSWASKFGIDGSIRLKTTLETGSFDDQRRMWTLNVRHAGEIKTLTCKHLIMAVGVGGQIPFIPALPGREAFKGAALHSAEYQNSHPWKGKHGIVVGTANTAHDVVEDMLEAGLSSVTMIQRRRTYVLPVEHLKVAHGRLHNDELPTAVADRKDLSMPYGVARLIMRLVLHDMASKEPERFDALEMAGFKVEQYGDPTYHIYERLGGHYVDVGASAKIAKGLVSIKFPIRDYLQSRNIDQLIT